MKLPHFVTWYSLYSSVELHFCFDQVTFSYARKLVSIHCDMGGLAVLIFNDFHHKINYKFYCAFFKSIPLFFSGFILPAYFNSAFPISSHLVFTTIFLLFPIGSRVSYYSYIHPCKFLFCVYWNRKVVVDHDVMERRKIRTADIYWQQSKQVMLSYVSQIIFV